MESAEVLVIPAAQKKLLLSPLYKVKRAIAADIKETEEIPCKLLNVMYKNVLFSRVFKGDPMEALSAWLRGAGYALMIYWTTKGDNNNNKDLIDQVQLHYYDERKWSQEEAICLREKGDGGKVQYM